MKYDGIPGVASGTILGGRPFEQGVFGSNWVLGIVACSALISDLGFYQAMPCLIEVFYYACAMMGVRREHLLSHNVLIDSCLLLNAGH